MRFVAIERQNFIMSMHLYRGFEIYPLIYPHVQPFSGYPRNYDAGFDAAVKIWLRGTDDTLTRSQTFRLIDNVPFETVGNGRRASLRYAEGLIDNASDNPDFFSDAR